MSKPYVFVCGICSRESRYTRPVRTSLLEGIENRSTGLTRTYKCESCNRTNQMTKSADYWRAVDASTPPDDTDRGGTIELIEMG